MIMRVQSKLHELGYYTGTIDGVFGSGTKDALRRFQLVKQLPATGRMDDATLAALGITY
ncbi:MAG TPA: peptidoglycan-binding protein [Rhizomicrobium sp.]|nr:peptidoglycan-binding protein [Rhizomicrobium sp.]